MNGNDQISTFREREPICTTAGCSRIATRHCAVALGSLPLEYDYCQRCAVRVEAELINAGYRPVFTDLKKKEKITK